MHQASMCEFQIEFKFGMEDQFLVVEIYRRRFVAVEMQKTYNRVHTLFI